MYMFRCVQCMNVALSGIVGSITIVYIQALEGHFHCYNNVYRCRNSSDVILLHQLMRTFKTHACMQ